MPFIYTLKVTVAFVATNPLGLCVSSTPYYYRTAQVYKNSPKRILVFLKGGEQKEAGKESGICQPQFEAKKTPPISLLSDWLEINKSLLIRIKKMKPESLDIRLMAL